MKANVISNVIANQFVMDQSRDNSVLYNSLYAESPSIRTTTSKHVGRFFKKCNFQFHLIDSLITSQFVLMLNR